MFGAPSTANKKRGSVGTVTTTATSTPIPTNSLFGSQPAATSTPLFSSQPTATSTQPNSLFGGQASTTTTTAPSNSLFGAQNPTTTTTTTSSNSLFGAQKPTTTTPFMFGAAPATSSAPTSSPFGAQNTTNSLLQTSNNNQQQQQQQQGQAYLDLDTCFPETKVPHFVVTPNLITRTVVPANFFRGQDTRELTSLTNSKAELNNNEPLSVSVGFNERISVLPNYLTSFDNTNSTSNNKSSNNFSLKKRVLEDEDMGRNTLKKTTVGLFSSKETMTYGFDKNLSLQDNQKIPVESLREVGFPSSASQFESFNLRPDTNTGNDLYRLYNNTSLLQPKKTSVRVFGYDQKNVEQIIKYFTSLGELSKPYLCQGNWIIFDYVSHEIALKALKCNGMNIDRDHLVGVTWDERAEEVEYLRYQRINESTDLYKKTQGFMNIFNQSKSSVNNINGTNGNGDQRILDKIREKFLGW